MSPSSYSGLCPQTRQHLENMILSLLSRDSLTSPEIRLKLRKDKLVRGNLPIDNHRISLICKALKKAGHVQIVGEKSSNVVWAASF